MNRSHKNSTRLLNAIAHNNLLEVRELIRQGADVNQVDMANDPFTPLMLAIDMNLTDIVELLVNAGADLYKSTYAEDSPLGLAAIKGNLEIVKLLLQAGADPDFGELDAPIYNAITGENLHIFKTLINSNADVYACCESGTTALMMAAITGNMEIVEILLEEGANPDAINKYGDIALDKAAHNGHQEVFDYLILLTSASVLEGREYLEKELAIGILRKKRKAQKEKNKLIKRTS